MRKENFIIYELHWKPTASDVQKMLRKKKNAIKDY